MKSTIPQKFRFKKHSDIGTSGAESDEKFLKTCFIDNGDISELLDLESKKSIIVGRTGAGKSALIRQILQSSSNVITLDLEALSLVYISNSDIIRFFEEAGVDLDVFYSLLWRHIFTVELLKKRFKLVEDDQRSLMETLTEIFRRDKRKEQAIKYLKEWGEHFWQETEYRVKEFVQNLERALTEKSGINFQGINLSSESAKKLSEQMRTEVIHKAQKIVSEVQIKDLGKVIDLLADDIFNDVHNPYYITIDKLDEGWTNEKNRYQLIRALLETLRTFQRIPGVKIVVGLRVDLLERVFEKTRNLGFQEEKYEALYLPLRWSSAQLKSVVEKRINFLIRQAYTLRNVTVDDIFPHQVHGQNAFEYMTARTFSRPRDIILFVNACLSLSEGKEAIPASLIKEAESEYSKKRLRSLADEWHADYPGLIKLSQFFLELQCSFKFSDISKEKLDKFIMNQCCDLSNDDPIYKAAAEVGTDSRSYLSFFTLLLRLFYRVGIIGVKTDAFNQVQWSFNDQSNITDASLQGETSLHIHPMFWRALGIEPAARPKRGGLRVEQRTSPVK